MRTITGLVLIIFSGNIMRIDCKDENMLTVTYEFIKIEQFEENKFIERTGDNSIAWKEDSDNHIYAFIGIEATQELLELGYICQKTQESEINEERDKLVTFFLAQDKPCPIKKGTTSNLENQVLKTQRKQGKSICGSETGELLLFDYSNSQDLIISISLKITNSGCQ